jgi:hypothetical protein
MAAAVNRFAPVVRGEGKGIIVPMSNWIDGFLLAAATARSYTLPTGTDPSGGAPLGPTGTPPGASRTATILRVWNITTAVLWVNAQGTAAVEAADKLTGLASVPIMPTSSFMFQIPLSVTSISMISTPGGEVIIEAWW